MKTFLKERLMQPDATLKFIVQDRSPGVPTYGSTRQHTSLGSIHAVKGHMVKWYDMCVQLGHGFHKQAKHFNSTTPPQHQNTTPVGFEPTRGDPIGLAGRRLNRSAKVSLVLVGRPPLQEGAAHAKDVCVAAQAESENGSLPSH